MSYSEIVAPLGVSDRLRRINRSRTRIDLAFGPADHPLGVWTGSSSPCEPEAQQLLSALIRISGTRGVYVADPEHIVGSPVAFLEHPAPDDWARLDGGMLDALSAAIVVADNGSWCVAWSNDDFLACGAAPPLVKPFREALAQAFTEITVEDVQQIIDGLRQRAAPSFLVVEHYGRALAWAYPVGHPVRVAWDNDPLVRRITADLPS